MKVAVTGATGFVGSHLVRALLDRGDEAVLIVRDARCVPGSIVGRGARVVEASLAHREKLLNALTGCDALVHCAGINRERGPETYSRVHIDATQNLADAAGRAGVRRLVLLSFLRARPACGSKYHESKWAAEQIVRSSGLDYTILKAGVIYGRGDHMLDHLSHALHTFPVFGLVGFRDQPVRPVAVDDVTRVILASLEDERLSRKTVAVTGPEQMTLAEAVRRVAQVVDRDPLFIRLPVFVHYLLAQIFEQTMRIPLVSTAQVRILSESLVDPLPLTDELFCDLQPQRRFTSEQIRAGFARARTIHASRLLPSLLVELVRNNILRVAGPLDVCGGQEGP